ncbi:MAG: ZPR1 zinc finger domain-containing protein [Nanoarchaeota archaeon]
MPEEEVLSNQHCIMCKENTLTLTEKEIEVPYFGRMTIFSMTCSNCKFHKADVEALEQHKPCKWTLEVSSQEDLNIRIIKSSEATIKIPYISDITPGPGSQGFITNVEGILKRIKRQVDSVKESSEDKDEKKAAWKLLKKINRILWGSEKCKIIIDDPSGNSAIISQKAKKEK